MESQMCEIIARACHEVNRSYCELVGDNSQVRWDDAPEWQRSSAVLGVHAVMRGETPAQLHESWCETKRADGWVFGDVKDAEAKTHPCLVPYHELPEVQKEKDRLFRRTVLSLLPEPIPASEAPCGGSCCEKPEASGNTAEETPCCDHVVVGNRRADNTD